MSHADHEWAKEQIAAHLAGGLSADERARLEAHASGCAECIAEIDAARRFDRSMDQLFAPIRPKPGFEDRIIRGLREKPAQGSRSWTMNVFLAVAATVLLGVVGYCTLFMNTTETVALSENRSGSKYWAGSTPQLESPATGGGGPIGGTVVPNDPYTASALRVDGAFVERAGREFGDSSGQQLRTAREMAQQETALAFNALRSELKLEKESDFRSDDKDEIAESLSRNARSFRQSGEYGRPVPMELPKPVSPPPPSVRAPVAMPVEEAKKMNRPEEGTYSYRSNVQGNKSADPGYFKPGDLVAKDDAAIKGSAVLFGAVPAKPRGEPEKAPQLGAQAAPPQNPAVQESPQQSQRKIIRQGEMEFEIEGFDSTVANIAKIVAEEAGFIATVNSEKLPNGKVRGTVILRCPPERLDTLILKLRGLGELKSQRITSQDVSKAYFDIESRLRAARTMEERLLKIIKDGKGEIKDLLQAEKELGEWRTKIETLEGEIRYYNNLIGLSTLTLTLFEKEIRSPFAITETERVQMGIEAEDVEKAHKDALAAVAEAKGRVTRSDLKQHAAGQYTATLYFEVAPEAAGPLRDRLKQLGHVARLDVNRVQQTEGGSGKVQDLKVRQKETEFQVSIYNLANIAPREIVHVNLACVDAEKSYKAILDRVEKAAGRVRSSNLNRQKSDQTSGVIDFEIKAAEAEAVLLDVRAQGEVMFLQVTENSDTANATRSKRGFVVNVVALGAVQPRETTNIQLASKDVAGAYHKLLEAIKKAEGRVLAAQLNENDRRNVSATLTFDVRREFEKAIADAMAGAGDIYTRSSHRQQDSQNVVDSKVQINLTIINVANVPPRENVTLAIEVNVVSKAVEALHAIVSEGKGRLQSANHSWDDGRAVSRMVLDVPLKDSRVVTERIKKLGDTKVERNAPNPAVPDSDLAVARLDITLSREVIVPADSGPWDSIKKGLSVSLVALSWALVLVVIGLCLVGPIALLVWGGWKLTKRIRKPAAPAA